MHAKKVVLVALISTILAAGAASGSTAWPEEGKGSAPADIAKLRARGLESVAGPDGRRRLVIDDQHFIQDEVRLAGFSARKWTDGNLIYQFSSSVSETNRTRFTNACREWERVASVRCVSRTNQSVYLLVTNGTGNSADVGMPRSGRAYLRMYNWSSKFIIVHEIGHALGLTHEQCRTGRGEFVKILWRNLRPGTRRVNFDEHQTTNLSPYDFESVMHYDDRSFGQKVRRNGRSVTLRTIEVLPPNQRFQTIVGQRNRLSTMDATGMSARYGPPGSIR